MSGIFRGLVRQQVRLSKRFDRRVFGGMSTDGNGYFLSFVAGAVRDGSRVADVGGGKRPFFPPDQVAARGLKVTGIDIDPVELSLAPVNAYASTLVSPLEEVTGPAMHDVVIAQSVLEHVRNGADAIRGCAALLQRNGEVFTFCPNRRAWFAVLNRLLPEGFKRALLFGIFPEKREKQGFPAYYDGCTPEDMQQNMEACGLKVVEVRTFYVSSYFMFFFPLYLCWRIATWPLMKLFPERYCETFMIRAVKP